MRKGEKAGPSNVRLYDSHAAGGRSEWTFGGRGGVKGGKAVMVRRFQRAQHEPRDSSVCIMGWWCGCGVYLARSSCQSNPCMRPSHGSMVGMSDISSSVSMGGAGRPLSCASIGHTPGGARGILQQKTERRAGGEGHKHKSAQRPPRFGMYEGPTGGADSWGEIRATWQWTYSAVLAPRTPLFSVGGASGMTLRRRVSDACLPTPALPAPGLGNTYVDGHCCRGGARNPLAIGAHSARLTIASRCTAPPFAPFPPLRVAVVHSGVWLNPSIFSPLRC